MDGRFSPSAPLADVPAALALAKADLAGDKGPLALTLADHCADVAASFRALLRLAGVRGRLARLAGRDDLTDQECDRLSVLAALHDAGKVTVRFQRRIRGDKTAGGGHIGPLWSMLNWNAARNAAKRQRQGIVRRSLDLATVGGWFQPDPDLDPDRYYDNEPLHMVLSAILAHHGALTEAAEPAEQDWAATGGYDPLTALADLSARVRRWFPLAFAGDVGEALTITARFTYALAGLMVWADWLGSDTAAFPLMGLAELAGWGDDRFGWSTGQAAAMLRARHLDASLRQAGAAALPWGFAGLFPDAAAQSWQPRPLQQAMLGLDVAGLRPGATLVAEAETGSGKTEAAIALFLALLRAGRVDGMYFALPTRASAVQIHARIRDALQAALGEQVAPPVGLAVPGYLRVDGDDGVRLPGHRIAWPDGDAGRLDDRRWAAAHSSRYLAGPVMVGTIDQLLLGGLQVRHAPLRSAAMLRQLLVVDECHASETYTNALLCNMLDQHRAAGGFTLLMSATLGAVARAKLTNTKRPDLAAACEVPYPCLLGAAGVVPLARDATLPAREISLERHNPAALEALVRRAISAAEAGAHVLIMRNTVRDAAATQLLLEGLCPNRDWLFQVEGRPAPHHARFAAEDRQRLDEALQKAFGGGRSEKGCIAVTTQTAEQSLDIDADLLITDLCPADVLLQRLGRLHRHRWRNNRPEGFTHPRALILSPGAAALADGIQRDGKPKRGAGSGVGTVYRNLLALAATAEALAENPVWQIPTMNRALVENITHPDALLALARRLDGGTAGLWSQHYNHIWGKSAAEQQLADQVRLNWQEWDAAKLEQEGEAATEVTTRLGDRDRRVELDAGTMGAFGHPVTALTIPAHLLRGVPLEAMPAVEAMAEGLRVRVESSILLYDRFGLRT
ncbi:CRISPR-associated helicase Cas3' [Niveispirillum sp. SYP-B3756]|uniref:CRISPR-associated helicase Cas3' n=1 Tax=Niveispirillum sp. SYP-B3756 TaxID=2662178 RepID=UPI0012909198|nr:CRISPR-associated helicase Cas3' [Niveispirillum sp. SYP-B3756]MQP65509.1 CRISPR-associated helicase Cas3' [Niveispirillum sp. SYP-B3756]